ncbi:hypothetical protein INR49_028071 [Caranx melampygus]|nr:hypothetical protein INR49_028071 [Caranx melampygus]
MEGNTEEDTFFELYCEEVGPVPTGFDSEGDCQQTDAPGQVPCPSVTTTVYELSSTVVSQHVDSPAGELERHIVTFCSEGKNVQEIMDLEPEVKNSLQAPEEVKDENTDRPANGDASNIPLRWVSDVLSELNALVSPKNKILVVTVLGVQSTGKSTLLNTMFGVQFAVSSGRCTRGAFMLLIRIDEDVKRVLNCDFMVIIDTEGLKSPELAQLDDSHEHDNELATLVVGLSDITIINIAMENSTEVKDILQIVVHAFLRMKEVGKKPQCQFVHQNVSDVSAHEKNLRDRKLLLEQLNEMTQAAAKMEKKEENKSFTDVMEYNPDTGNWYIPGLWNGNPPMAPVSAGYSEAVYELKKNVIQLLGRCESSANDILEFKEWMSSLWTAVKHENFIFSFRNSLVADAYMRLSTEFNKWEWEFKKHMYEWSLLYSGCGVGVGQGVVVASGGEGVKGMKRLHAGDGTGDHGDGVRCHQGHVVGGTAQRQCVVRRAGRPEDVVGPEGLHVVVSIVLRVLHLQGHDLLLLTVSQVIGRAAPLRRQPVAPHLVPLVSLVVKSCEGQDVEEEERRPYSHRHTQLSGIVPGVSREEVLVWTL